MIVFRLGKHLHDLWRKGKHQKYCKQQKTEGKTARHWWKKRLFMVWNLLLPKTITAWRAWKKWSQWLSNFFPRFHRLKIPMKITAHVLHSQVPKTAWHSMGGRLVGWNRRRGEGADCGLFKKLRVIQLLCKKWRIKDVVVFFCCHFPEKW